MIQQAKILNASEINYEQLIKQIKADNPQNSTELILSIEKALLYYNITAYTIVCALDQDLKRISKINGPSLSSKS